MSSKVLSSSNLSGILSSLRRTSSYWAGPSAAVGWAGGKAELSEGLRVPGQCGPCLQSLDLPHPHPGLLPRGSCWPSLPSGYPNSPVLPPGMAEELSELLREFDEVMEDFDRGPPSQYQQHLEELKKKVGQSVYDSGIDELESESGG